MTAQAVAIDQELSSNKEASNETVAADDVVPEFEHNRVEAPMIEEEIPQNRYVISSYAAMIDPN